MCRQRPDRVLTGPQSAAERIELALDSGAIVGTFVWDIPADCFTSDERFARTFGLDPAACAEGVPLGAIITVIHPDDLPRVEKLIADTVVRGGNYRTEYRIRQHDGLYRWVTATGRCEHDAAGNPTRFPGVLVDIEDLKRAEDRLRASEAAAREANALLRAVIESVPALIYVKDRAGRIRIANKATLDVIGKPLSEVQDRTDAEYLADPVQADIIMATDRRVMETGGARRSRRRRGSTRTGRAPFCPTRRRFVTRAARSSGWSARRSISPPASAPRRWWRPARRGYVTFLIICSFSSAFARWTARCWKPIAPLWRVRACRGTR